jgi:transcriptional regulator with XRE-family HTH domain
MQLNKRIRHYREQLSLSQGEVAEQLGLSRLTYAIIESGERNPTINELEVLCRVFKINIEEMLELGETALPGDIVKYRQMCSLCIKYGGDSSDGKITKTKLAKLLYLVDFSWFRDRREPISGMRYYKLPLGPVAKPFFRIVDEMFDSGMITIESKGSALMISLNERPGADRLNPAETQHIQIVSTKWRDRDSQSIVEFTHRQAPWAETDYNEAIPYSLIDQVLNEELF